MRRASPIPICQSTPRWALLTSADHRPEETPLYRIVETCHPKFLARLEAEGASPPHFVRREFDDHLKRGLLEHGFPRVKCDACRHEHPVAFSCKRRGFFPSCGARRMVESAAHLVDHVLPEQSIRRWVPTFPYPLRFLFAARPQVLSQVLGVVHRATSGLCQPIIAMMPPHDTHIETHLGGGAIMRRKAPAPDNIGICLEYCSGPSVTGHRSGQTLDASASLEARALADAPSGPNRSSGWADPLDCSSLDAESALPP